MSTSSVGGPAIGGLTNLSGPPVSQATLPSRASGAGMSYSGLPGGRRTYPGHSPPSPVESHPSAGSMGMSSQTVSFGPHLVACEIFMDRTTSLTLTYIYMYALKSS